MTKARCACRIRLAAGVAVVSALLGVCTAAFAQAPTVDELLDGVRSDAPPRSAVKQDGSRYTTTAARYSATKDLLEGPNSPAKSNVVGSFRRPIPYWLRRTSPAGEEASLRHVPDVGFFPLADAELTTAYVRILWLGTREKGQEALAEAFQSPDFRGLPFVASSSREDQIRSLASSAEGARNLIERDSRREFDKLLPAPGPRRDRPDPFLEAMTDLLRPDATSSKQAHEAPIARSPELALPALLEVLSTQPAKYRIALIRALQKSPEGNRAAIAGLVRFALFDPDREVRAAAVRALQREPVRIYGPLLLGGFRYPWPIVAERAADALVALDRKELLPSLANLLDEPDPAAPIEVVREGRKVLAVRELVKLNHHANCIVCHAPANATDNRTTKGLVARLPSSERELPPESSVEKSPQDGKNARPLLMRADVTYLRPDFSTLQRVEGPGPWPKMQRYDYVVRVRAMLPAATVPRKRLDSVDEEIPSPHRRAVLYALSRLTSTYVGTLARDWRLVIEQPDAPARPIDSTKGAQSGR